MKKIIALVLTLMLCIAVFGGCAAEKKPNPDEAGSSPDATESDVPNEELDTTAIVEKAKELSDMALNGRPANIDGDPTIGVVMPTLDNAGWIAIYAGVVRAILENDVGLETYSANDDVQLQMNIIDDLIAKKVDGIIFVPIDSAACSVAVEKANEAGIPIVCMDRSTEGGEPDAVVVSDNVEIGREAARQMAKYADGKELKVFNLQGDMATSSGVERNQGFVEEIANYDNVEIVAEISGDWQSDKGNAAVLDAFQAHPEINAIYLPSDAYTQGVVAALEQLGKLFPSGDDKHILIISVDGQPIGVENVAQKYVSADVGQALFNVGDTSVNYIIDIIDGQTLKEPFVLVPPEVIDGSNYDSPDFWANQMK